MPKRALPPIAVAPVASLLPPLPPSPLIQRLRTDWKWAGISQFLWTFSDAFGLIDWDIDQLEADLDGDETRLLPDILVKLLYALTYNRQINRENAVENLRKQFLKRNVEKPPLGTLEEPIEWAALGLGQKVAILWDLCEWQLEDPARFRALLKSEDDATSWRIEPIGWDKAGNTYFLFDDNRLWIQRLPPPPPRPLKKSSQKAKRALKRSRPTSESSKPEQPAKKTHKKRLKTPEYELIEEENPKIEEPVSGARRRTQVAFYGNPTPTAQVFKRNTSRAHETPLKATVSPSQEAGNSARTTRSSRRVGPDGWQRIPDEWLTPAPVKAKGRGRGRGKGKQKQVEDESDLSDLTDEEEHEARLKSSGILSSPLSRANGKTHINGDETPLTPLDSPARSETPELTPDPEDEQMLVEDVPLNEKGDEMIENGGIEPDDAKDDSPGEQQDPPDQPSKEVREASPVEDVIMGEQENGQQEDGEAQVGAVEAVTSSGENQDAKPLESGADEGAVVLGGASAEDQQVAAVETTEKEEDRASTSPIPVSAPLDSEMINGAEPQDVPTNGDDVKEETTQAEEVKVEEPEEDDKEEDEVKMAVKESNDLPEGFVEWEAVCVTLYDWRTFPEQFAKSRDPDEKALYHMLHDNVAPQIIEALVIKEQERLKQEAVNNRKRSSRIATRELEKEEIARRDAAQREMEERMEKSRQEERRQEQEEKDAIAREKAREERLREREDRAAAREQALVQKALAEQGAKEKAEKARERRQRRREGLETSDTGSSREDTPATKKSDWELNCEVCRKAGWNLDDDEDVVSCDECGRWQHVECHDRLDLAEGRPKRNWEEVDFKCKDCRRKAARSREHPPPINTNGHHPYPPTAGKPAAYSHPPQQYQLPPITGAPRPPIYGGYAPPHQVTGPTMVHPGRDRHSGQDRHPVHPSHPGQYRPLPSPSQLPHHSMQRPPQGPQHVHHQMPPQAYPPVQRPPMPNSYNGYPAQQMPPAQHSMNHPPHHHPQQPPPLHNGNHGGPYPPQHQHPERQSPQAQMQRPHYPHPPAASGYPNHPPPHIPPQYVPTHQNIPPRAMPSSIPHGPSHPFAPQPHRPIMNGTNHSPPRLPYPNMAPQQHHYPPPNTYQQVPRSPYEGQMQQQQR